MPNLVLVPQSEVLTPIFQVSCPTSGRYDSYARAAHAVQPTKEISY